jgi:uncharacterized membrane protein
MRACHWPVSRLTRAGLLLLLLLALGGRGVAAAPAWAPGAPDPPVVLTNDGVARGVLFYSPTCPYCHDVIDDVLPPLREAYGARLVIIELDTTSPAGLPIWQAALRTYDPPPRGVPTLVIGEHVLIGARVIPQELPGIIESYLDAGGVGWPAIAGLEAFVAELDTSRPADSAGRVGAAFGRDPVGNTISVVVLVGLVAGLVAVSKPRPWQAVVSERAGLWLLLPLMVGLGISLYLMYGEVSGTELVCGPVGDCHAVQQSSFAVLFGVLPVAALGVIGYGALLLTYYAWWMATRTSIRRYAPGVLFVMAVLGLLFATYLTFLEPFVIGATCAWCLTQAVCMLAVVLLTAGPGWASLRTGRRKAGSGRALAR